MGIPNIKILYNPTDGLYQIQDREGGVDIDSSIKTKLISYYHTTQKSNYSIGSNSIIFGDSSLGNLIFTLPNAGNYNGTVFHIKKIDQTGNLITVSGSNGQTIDGDASLSIDSQYTTLSVISNGEEWFIL